MTPAPRRSEPHVVIIRSSDVKRLEQILEASGFGNKKPHSSMSIWDVYSPSYSFDNPKLEISTVATSTATARLSIEYPVHAQLKVAYDTLREALEDEPSIEILQSKAPEPVNELSGWPCSRILELPSLP